MFHVIDEDLDWIEHASWHLFIYFWLSPVSQFYSVLIHSEPQNVKWSFKINGLHLSWVIDPVMKTSTESYLSSSNKWESRRNVPSVIQSLFLVSCPSRTHTYQPKHYDHVISAYLAVVSKYSKSLEERRGHGEVNTDPCRRIQTQQTQIVKDVNAGSDRKVSEYH